MIYQCWTHWRTLKLLIMNSPL